MHTPVLLKEAIDSLNVFKDGKYVDATLGEGGYSSEIINRGGKVLAIDLDKNQISKSEIRNPKIVLVQGNFAEIELIAKENKFYPVDGVIFDLGLSMGQLSGSGRGFSFKNLSEPLDMRIDPMSDITAFDLIKQSNVDSLYEIFARNSEELASMRIAEEVFNRYKIRRMNTVGDLVQAIDKGLGEKNNRTYRRIFQALRIEVNHEFENLKKGLTGALSILKKEGKMVVVTFHSLEDRIVKNFIRVNNLKLLAKKPIKGKFGFERSAKIRVITKI